MFASVDVLVFTVLSLLLSNVAGVPTADPGIVVTDDVINALGGGLIQNFSASIDLESFLTNFITMDFTASNMLLLFEMTLNTVSLLAGVNDTAFMSFNHTFDPPVVIPALGTADSGTIDNVLMVQGTINSLDIIPLAELDILDMNVTIHVASIGGVGGIPITTNGLTETDVPTTYSLQTLSV
ncbi:hypothetical protein J3R30DRAFT_48548 [Lentinula aciculospora]|uniref:FAS1 domain-containing protein n=1 Tax=Lentinula aciculospora TaxID=153920 RepID=A0A9W9DYR2_9AGAR|nr:hypothetical protein J3R30DRAFT_48548 [Lentinula aciculospora]